jgi:hypothetical protein
MDYNELINEEAKILFVSEVWRSKSEKTGEIIVKRKNTTIKANYHKFEDDDLVKIKKDNKAACIKECIFLVGDKTLYYLLYGDVYNLYKESELVLIEKMKDWRIMSDNLMALYFKRSCTESIDKFDREIKEEYKMMKLTGETFKEYLEKVLK